MQEFDLKSEEETIKLAEHLATELKAGDTVLLYGDLGAGKTTLSRALINAISSEPTEVPSPTFTLVQEYDTKLGDLWHCDLYRLEAPEEVYELGWEEAQGNVLMLIEWPERLEYLKPKAYLEVTLTLDKETGHRHAKIQRQDKAA